jgi:hypothetical protein
MSFLLCVTYRFLWDDSACGEQEEKDINYQGDVRQLHAFGFDAVKFDGCGAQRNNTRYAELMVATGKNYSIENCHWGRNGNIGCSENDDGSACPSDDWCPFNWYRSSTDINSSPDSWFFNLQTVVPVSRHQVQPVVQTVQTVQTV